MHLAEMPSGRPPMARYGAGRSLERFGVGDYNRTRTVTRPDSGWSIKFDDEYVVKQGVVSIRVRRASEGSGSSGEFAVAGTLTGCPGEFSALVTASRRQSGAGDGSRQPWAVTSSGGGARMSWSSGAAPPVCQRC